MSQRKLIAVLGLVALLAFTAGVSQASKSRVEGMNLSIPTLAQHTDDYVNIYYFPTSVVRQNNLVLAELGNNPGGTSNGYFFGGNVLTNDQSFAIVRNFARFGAIAYEMKASQLNDPVAGSNLNHHQLDLIWGKAFTKIDLAARLDIANSGYEQTTATGSYEENGFNGPDFDPFPFVLDPDQILGTGVEINSWGITPAIAFHLQNDNRFEAAVTFRNYSLDRSITVGGVAGEKWEDDASASYLLAARMFLNQNDRHTWIPAGWYSNADLSWTVTNFGGVAGETRAADETYKSYGVGISDNMKVNDNNLLLWGIQFNQQKHDYERTDADVIGSGDTSKLEDKSSTTPIIFAAIETDATKWLKVRIGAHQAYMTTEEKETVATATPATTTTKTHVSDFGFSLGTGIRWNNLDIDMTLNEKFPISGGYVLSGDNSTPFTRASATYHF